MAEETKPENQEQEEESQPQKKSKKLLWIMIAVAVIVVAGGGAGTYVMMGGKEPAAEEETTETETVASTGLVPLDTFLVNLNDPAGERYMKLSLRLTVSPEEVADELKNRELLMAKMRDRVLTILMSKTFQEMNSPLGKEGLRIEIRAQLNPLLEDGEVEDVLFSEFVVQ
jgi:flagellar FliL protein